MSDRDLGTPTSNDLYTRALIGGVYGVIAGVAFEQVEAAIWSLDEAERLFEIVLEVSGFGFAGAALCVACAFKGSRFKS